MGASLGQIADSIVTAFRGRVGAAFDRLPAGARQTLVDCANDAAALQVEALAAGAADLGAAERLAREKRQIDAQMANLEVAALETLQGALGPGVTVQDAFWASALDVFHSALGLAMKVALA